MKGSVKLEVIDAKTGRIVSQEDLGENLLVDNFYIQLSYLVGSSVIDNWVNRMQFGTGSSAAQATDTTLQMPISPIKAVTVDHPTATTTRFTSYLLETEGNGFPIGEAALICGDDTLVARKTFAGQVKSADYIFAFKWTISQ